MQPVVMLLVLGGIMFLVIGGLSLLAHYYTLNGIKSKTVASTVPPGLLPRRKLKKPMWK